MNKGSIRKTCSCRDAATDRRIGARCPDLRRPGGSWSPSHGWWAYQLELPAAPGTARRRQLRRSGFATRDAAATELDHAETLLALAGRDIAVAAQIASLLLQTKSGQPLPERDKIARRIKTGLGPAAAMTMTEFLWQWHGSRKIEPTTLSGYAGHIRNYLEPYLGHLPVDELRVGHVQAMFDAIAERNIALQAAKQAGKRDRYSPLAGARVVSGATMHRIRATLRKALNDAIRAHRLIEFNPAAHVELPSGRRPKAKVWTAAAVTQWQATGHRPSPVMVWTPAQAGAFLDYAEGHDIVLYPLFLLILHRGLRRGEAVGLRDADVDLDTGSITIAQQITTLDGQPITKKVKSDAGERTVALDDATLRVLHTYKARRVRWQLVSGPDWPRIGLFFVQPDGTAYHPEEVSNRFEALVADARLPPIRLHDLRHCAATYLKASGADLKDIQETLGHSSITITGDTYTSVIHELDAERAKAHAATALIPRSYAEAE
ncbi:tyrosine-type recombinase/integrase [Actinoplanes sp. NPDC051633]|uniref:tyrosine-type recombinase/integrase n=1 Tax=Actinoplanes sp. NPDC051633 TaxID=3155670 RepID=UPI003440A9FE